MSNMDVRDTFTYNSTTGATYQTLTGGDAAGQQTIDLGATGKHHFSGDAPVYLNVRIKDAVTTGDGLTSIAFRLGSDTSSGFATALKQILEFNIAIATMTAGAAIISVILPDQSWQQHLRMYFNNVGGTASAGSCWAWLSNVPLKIESQIDLVETA
jgi:hypothetical protein